MDHIAAIGIGAHGERLALVHAHQLVALAQERVEGRLVAVEVIGRVGIHAGAAAAGVEAGPFEGLGVEVHRVALLVRDGAVLALGGQHGFVRDLLRLFEVRLDLGELRLGHGIGAALFLDLGKALVVGLLELIEAAVQRLDGFGYLLHVIHGTCP